MFKKYLEGLYQEAEAHKKENIKKALKEVRRGGILLDVGCWDGEYTMDWVDAMSADKVFGIEVLPEAIKLAKSKKIRVFKTDLNTEKWPLKNGSVDCVVSNLVIEHLSNVDHFISESYRVLKAGGSSIVSTNNLSSWHNILSLFFGWAPLDLTNSSKKTWSIGNPLALHNKEESYYDDTFTHKCVYTARWLEEWYGLYGFELSSVYGAGYYPLPAFIGNIDKIHSAFITLRFKK